MHVLAGVVALLQASAGTPVSSQDIRAALPATFEVVRQELPTGPSVTVLVPRRPRSSILQPVVLEYPSVLTYLIWEGTTFPKAPILDAARDTAIVRQEFAAALGNDPAFMTAFVPFVQATVTPGVPGATRSLERALQVGARFFYPSQVRPDGTIRSDVCANARGVVQLAGPRDLQLEGFVYQAITNRLLADPASFMPRYEELVASIQADGAGDLAAIRGEVWSRFERDPVLRDIILAEYHERQSTLPFRLE